MCTSGQCPKSIILHSLQTLNKKKVLQAVNVNPPILCVCVHINATHVFVLCAFLFGVCGVWEGHTLQSLEGLRYVCSDPLWAGEEEEQCV